jgi:uncharacterized repeat protein (TIGR01451 family)
MLSKLLNLLEPLKRLKYHATLLRLGLAGVVLGVGGFAVYKGMQQMKPPRPAPKRTVTAANQILEQQNLDPPQQPAQDAGVTVASNEAPLYDSGSAYGNYGNADANPAVATEQTGAEAQDIDHAGADGQGAAIPPSPQQEYLAGQYAEGSQGGESASPQPLSRRPNARAPAGYHIGDESPSLQQPDAIASEPIAGDMSAETSGARDQEPAPLVSADASAAAPHDDESTPDAASSAATPRALAGIGSQRQGSYGLGPAANASGQLARAAGNPPPQPLGPPAAAAAVPGDRRWEGTQVPSVAIEKFAPAEIQVGKPATLEIRVRNVGQVTAHDVLVTDHVPQGTRLEATSPQAETAADGSLLWRLGHMQPGDEALLTMQVLPEQEGEIGSVAQVSFAGKATTRSICTRPLLAVEHAAPKQVLIGEPLRLAITVTNPGTGAATGVMVEEDVPEGLTHVAGSELEYEVGTLRPGETRQLELQLTAAKAGLIENVVTVRGDGNLIAQHKVQIEVIAPKLEVAVSGPKRRYLERQATYTLSLANSGTAAARNVELVAFLPKGMRFFSTDAEGRYDAAQHAVFWSLEELPAAKSGSVNLVTVPIEVGEQRLRVEGRADLGLAVAREQVVQVEAKSELTFDIVDVNDPIEVGTETTYEIRVANNGTRPATGVELAAGFPAEIKPVSAEGHSRGQVTGQQVIFEPVGRINPGEEAVFRIHARGERQGDHVIAVQIRSAEFPTPVTREESTRVYLDR